MAASELVNKSLVKAWLWWSLVWITLFPLVGLLISIKFHIPGFLGDIPWLTYGRVRPVHVNGVIFGAFSTPFLGLLYYLVPRLCGRPMAKENWGWWQLAVWNLFVIAGSISLLAGWNLGFEAGEFQWPFNILRWAVLAALGGQVMVTILRRRERGFYVALWYVIAALVWTLMNLILGNAVLPYVPMSGISNAALHGLYIHYVVGLWITPAGLALMYYFLPLAVNNPLFSHRLSLLGFWSLALFYPFVGTHHYIYSPIPFHTQTLAIVTSMLLIIPVWTVTANFYGTAMGRWGRTAGGSDGDSYGAKFLLLGALYYVLGCFQGSVESLRRMQELTHFNDFVISHSHFTIFGTFIIWVSGAMYFVWPRVTGRQLWSARLASWHLWLTISGASVMFLGLAAQGFVQGGMLEYGANFVDTVKEMMPWWEIRTLAGATMDIGLALMAVNLVQSARFGKPFEEPVYAVGLSEGRPAGEAIRGWLSGPSAVAVIAGIAFFAAAVLIQGIMPSLMPETSKAEVVDAATGKAIAVAGYTPLEQHGREVYIREGCWYCHSQYVRPATGEAFRWGPVSQAGEYAFDQPHLLSTRRTGPDLTRVGRKVDDGWHAAHYWNPRDVVPDSIMPRFPWLFEPAKKGEPPRLNTDGKALVAYVQRLGTSIGDWREIFVSTRLDEGAALRAGDTLRQKELLPLGRQTYTRRCAGCHGEKGDGNGPSARFLDPRPRDFTSGIFKFHSTPIPNALPTDQDLFLTVTHGLWGTAMPPWYDISAEERLAVVRYLKTFSDRWQKEEPGEPLAVAPEPPVSAASLKAGAERFAESCAVCHGNEGRGDGLAAAGLADTWGHPARPANFTLPAGAPGGVKLGHDGRHLFKTIMSGVGGTPMPSFAASFTPEQLWDIVHYVQSLRVAAHLQELQKAGLKDGDAAAARRELWAALSEAASRGRIDRQITERRQP
ncbi:MAG: cbb3-type cytochrome c oxidase subunit I [Pseudomonadota bacterium]